jgi:nicotinamidase-related amidase
MKLRNGNSCVAISAIDAHKRGYNVTLPCRCIGVKNKERFLEKKEELRKEGIIICE